jgi:hypothetical protein
MGISQQIGASSLIKPGVCTSTTRPASPYTGQVIYETDTNLQYSWNGSSWIKGATLASPTFTGTVLRTEQPIISGQIGSSGDITSGQLVPFDDFWVSRGITYNSSTRRFTVPTTGVYRITMNPFFNTGSATKRIMVGVDTDTPSQTTHRGMCYTETANYDTLSINSVVAINANSYIVFRVQEGTLYNRTNDRFNQFSIELIG